MSLARALAAVRKSADKPFLLSKDKLAMAFGGSKRTIQRLTTRCNSNSFDLKEIHSFRLFRDRTT
ncbi:hypothetical protein, partial [Granulicella sp. S190]|uniref:hypothetical protein n=1 Tax=Granulicella sp. S190 TaxID=1747226 RepID=UPI001C204B25